jgi:hypothetical protein
MKKLMISLFMPLCFLTIILGPVFAGQIDLQLLQKTDYIRQDFGSGTYTAYSMLWAGDVFYMGNKIGDYTTSYSKTTYTGDNGSTRNCDIIIPTGGAIGEFISIRTNHITTGSGSDHGTIYAASPAFKSFIGYSVVKSGNTLSILY